MFVNIQIPDEVYQVYADRKPERPQAAIAEALKEFILLVPGEARIIIQGENLKELKRDVGWPLDSAADMLYQMKKAARVTLGEGLEVKLSPDQRARLRAMSDFWARPGDDKEEAFRKFVTERVQTAINQVVGA